MNQAGFWQSTTSPQSIELIAQVYLSLQAGLPYRYKKNIRRVQHSAQLLHEEIMRQLRQGKAVNVLG